MRDFDWIAFDEIADLTEAQIQCFLHPEEKPCMTGNAPLTFGQKAVGLTFNPSGDAAVHQCKAMFAALIDQMNDLRENKDSNQEMRRLASIAITEAQGAQMWAVKALTWKA